ncbi:hypothetical protein I8748_10810 [Nostoc sp. CENA67]|uniref:Uncharacterized protein n=1 Tax=Amazonocrinis nigriterrae CENA67 TaxID=2794033 RepID=A0A8J7HNL4_9NOST|nr:hypothetical protein [Amazonocrinis nigriterrae]MBH8562662.1 hypothetical protein [Amazonocrinis nigriterrae CENA67]
MLKKSIIAYIAALRALLPCHTNATEIYPHAYAIQLPTQYNDNSNKPDRELKLKTQDDVTKVLGNRKIKEIKFLKWKDAKPPKEDNPNIDGNRKVWKVTADYVGGIDFDSGRCKSNAKLTQVLDAETGDNLMLEVRCLQGSFESSRPKPSAEELKILENSR